jgi:NAD(P)H-hydrate repair Nnr-like enzyme with NAD(P)H-hydrate dehydratase domain
LNAGAGFIRYVGVAAAKDAILTRCPSVTFGTGRVQAWLVGSGWDEDQFNLGRLLTRIDDGVPMVIDAGALFLLEQLSALPDGCLLTPHAGELARLLGVPREVVGAGPAVHAATLARQTGACVLIKGHDQYAVLPDGEALLAVGGPSWSAQAGSGDVLAGISATVLAAGVGAQLAGAMAASVQAMVAERYPGPLPPDRLAERLPGEIGRFG